MAKDQIFFERELTQAERRVLGPLPRNVQTEEEEEHINTVSRALASHHFNLYIKHNIVKPRFASLVVQYYWYHTRYVLLYVCGDLSIH